MIIDGVEYEPVDKGVKRKQIVIAHRGFVYVGDVKDHPDEVIIYDAANVRRWGTDKGLGQLAIEGVQEDTVLDECGTVRMHPLSIVARIDCEVSKW